MHRVFVPASQIPEITGSDVHYLRDVLRAKVNDPIELLDGTGKIYEAKILKIEKGKIICKIISSRRQENEPGVKVTLAQALPKARKMDFIIEKCIELGVNQIMPVLTERTVGKSAKLDRWRRIAKEAAEQSGRAIIPEVFSLIQFADVLKMRNQFDLVLIPWELEKGRTLKQSLRSPLLPPFPHILVLIGPEGGFSQKEIELAGEAGFISISLGKRILRTETAGMAVTSAIMYEME